MTAFRVEINRRPMHPKEHGYIHPMSKEDRAFWARREERRK